MSSTNVSPPSLLGLSRTLGHISFSNIHGERPVLGTGAEGDLEVNTPYSHSGGNAETCQENMTEHDPRRELRRQVCSPPPLLWTQVSLLPLLSKRCSGASCLLSCGSEPLSGLASAFHLCLIPIKSFRGRRREAPLRCRWGRGSVGGGRGAERGRRQSRWVGGKHSGNKDREARRQSRGEGTGRGSV